MEVVVEASRCPVAGEDFKDSSRWPVDGPRRVAFGVENLLKGGAKLGLKPDDAKQGKALVLDPMSIVMEPFLRQRR